MPHKDTKKGKGTIVITKTHEGFELKSHPPNIFRTVSGTNFPPCKKKQNNFIQKSECNNYPRPCEKGEYRRLRLIFVFRIVTLLPPQVLKGHGFLFSEHANSVVSNRYI